MAIGDVLDSFAAPSGNAWGLTWDGSALRCSTTSTNLIHRIDPDTGTILDDITAGPVGNVPTGLAWDNNNSLRVASQNNNRIYRIDPATGTVLDSVTRFGTLQGVAWDGTDLWYADTSDTIYRVNPTSGALIDSFAAPDSQPTGLAWDGQFLWVADGGTDLVYQIDPSDGSVVSSFSTPAGTAAGLAWDGVNLWLVESAFDVIYKLEGPVYNDPPNAPLVADQGTFDRNSVNRVTWTFSDPDAGDSQSAAELRYRASGTSTWTVVNIGNPNQFWDAPVGTFTADLYEAQVRTADQSGVWGPWSASFFITATDNPGAPIFTDPTNGQTIPTDSYTGTISHADVDESEWTLYADNAGTIDTTTILQGPVTKTTGDLRSHTWTGLANGVPVWWSTRVKFEGLYGSPAQIRTPVSYTAPAVPEVSYSQPAGEPVVDVFITNPAPTGDQPTVSYNDVFVNDERRATFVARNSTWRYWTPEAGFDPEAEIVVRAVGENGTSAESTPTTELPEPGYYGGGY